MICSFSLATFGIFLSFLFYSFTMFYLYLGFFYSTWKIRFISVIISEKFSIIISSIISFPQFSPLSSFRVQNKYFLFLFCSPYLLVSFIFSIFLPLCCILCNFFSQFPVHFSTVLNLYIEFFFFISKNLVLKFFQSAFLLLCRSFSLFLIPLLWFYTIFFFTDIHHFIVLWFMVLLSITCFTNKGKTLHQQKRQWFTLLPYSVY